MSGILSHQILIPEPQEEPCLTSDFDSTKSYSYKIRKFNLTDRDLYLFQEHRHFRAMNRSNLALSYCLHKAMHKMNPQWSTDARIGQYLHLQSGPTHFPTAKVLAEVSAEDYFERFKKSCPPKQHFKNFFGIACGNLSILAGLHGPANTYYTPDGLNAALDQACFDLSNHTIDYAIVGSAFAADDPLDVYKYQQSIGLEIVNEAAGLMILNKDFCTMNRKNCLDGEASKEYGPVGPLIHFLLSEFRYE